MYVGFAALRSTQLNSLQMQALRIWEMFFNSARIDCAFKGTSDLVMSTFEAIPNGPCSGSIQSKSYSTEATLHM
jgi:hypothetical protein